MTLDDLKSYQAITRAPVRGTYRGYDVVSMPLPSSAASCCWRCSISWKPADAGHEAGRSTLAACDDRSDEARLCRPGALSRRSAFVNAPIATLIAKDYAARQRASIDLDHATPSTDVLSPTLPREAEHHAFSVCR